MSRIGYGQSREERGLPSFAERTASDLESGTGEAVPLARWDENGYNARNNRYAPNASVADTSYDREQLPGVGTGYGRRDQNYEPEYEQEQDYDAYGDMYDASDPYAQPQQEAVQMQYQPNYAQNLGPSVQQRLRAGRNQPTSDFNAVSETATTPAIVTSAAPYSEGIAYAPGGGQREDPYAHGLTVSQGAGRERVRRAPSSVPSQYSDTYGNANTSGNDINSYPPQSPQHQQMSYYDYHQPEPSSHYQEDHNAYYQPEHAVYETEGTSYHHDGGMPESSADAATAAAAGPYASGSRGPPSYRTNLQTRDSDGYGGYYRGPLQDQKPQQYW